MGFLPFHVVSTHRKSDPVTLDDLEKALASVGGIHITTGVSHQVRFPSQEYAEEAYRQLVEKVPGPYWTIVKEVGHE